MKTAYVHRVPQKAHQRIVPLLASLAGLSIALPAHAVDLVTFAGVAGPLAPALTTLATLGPGAKAIVGFLAFVVALVALTAMRNFGPVIYYVGVAVFAAVGLPIAGAIMGAVI